VCKTPEEVQEVAKNMCGKILVSPESGQQGFLCRCVYIVEELDVAKELFVCVQYDRSAGMPVIIYGNWNGLHPEGTNVLQTMEEHNRNFRRIYVDVQQGLSVIQLQQVADELGISDKKSEMVFLLKHLYDCFIQRDAELIEVNPLVYTRDQKIVAAGTKVIIDDNALFRQAELKSEQDRTQVNYKERIA
jgi:succinyl-CoA synthetase beta subunit